MDKQTKESDSYFKLNKIEIGVVCILSIGIIGLTLKMFSISTLFYIGIVVFSSIYLIKSKLKNLRRLGIINILPPRFKYLLLNKSILDILMDFWHFPVLGKYLKLLVFPFIYNYTPEQSMESIQSLDPATQHFLQTKVNYFIY